MMSIVVGALIVGGILSRFFSVLILLPTTLLAVGVVAIWGQTRWTAMCLVWVALQLGYFCFGLFISFLPTGKHGSGVCTPLNVRARHCGHKR